MFEWLGNLVTNPMTWVVITALLHFVFMFVEMCQWGWLAPRVARLSAEQAEATKSIGFNMGLYNGFFAVGLVVTFFDWPTQVDAHAVQVFILICVVVAGIGGVFSLKRPGFLLQAAPAALALALM